MILTVKTARIGGREGERESTFLSSFNHQCEQNSEQFESGQQPLLFPGFGRWKTWKVVIMSGRLSL